MDKRQRIIEAARARFRHYGIAKTTMQEVATDAGVAVGTLYRYFKDKDDLAAACADDFIARHQRDIDASRTGEGPPDARLREYVLNRYRHCKEVGTESRHAAELARAVLKLKPERLAEESAMMRGAILGLLQEGIETRLFKILAPERDTIVFLLSIAFFFPVATARPPEWPKEEWLLMVVEWYLDTWKGATRAADGDCCETRLGR
jgi:AcrR family transcriptional regulator